VRSASRKGPSLPPPPPPPGSIVRRGAPQVLLLNAASCPSFGGVPAYTQSRTPSSIRPPYASAPVASGSPGGTRSSRQCRDDRAGGGGGGDLLRARRLILRSPPPPPRAHTKASRVMLYTLHFNIIIILLFCRIYYI